VFSPTHIGSGDRLTRIDYVYRNGEVRVIDYEKAWSEDERIRKMIELGRFDPKIAINYYKYKLDAFCKPDGEIMEHIKILGRPYIPGSSLKGTIRTALLWNYLKEKGLKIKSRKELRRIEQELFDRNLMRRLIVRDSEMLSVKDLGVYEIVILSERNGKTLEEKMLRTGRSIKIYVESLKPGTKLKIDLKGDNWKDKLLEFSKFVLSIDRKFFEERNDGRLDDILKFIDDVESKLNSGRILFRIGFSTGWLWKTVGSLLTREERLELAKKLKLSRKLGTDFPKTRRVIVYNGVYRWLPGWLEIID